jgi:putative SbcD/Mre11-related phosphoesterase
MEIIKGIEIRGKALWFKKEKALVFGDFHLGYEDALIDAGMLIPRGMFTEIKKEILKLLELKPNIVVINGDLKHEFSRISDQEWKDALELIDLIKEKAELVIIKGNHDKILDKIVEKRGLKTKSYFILGNIAILHGDEIILDVLDKKIKTLIIGHDHPAISLSDSVKVEKYKCFLLGKYKDKKLIVMPSFFNLVEGSDIKKEKLLSPFLRDIRNFEIFVLGDKAYRFGKLGKLKDI